MVKIKNLLVILVIFTFLFELTGIVNANMALETKIIPQRVFIDNLYDYNDYVIVGFCRDYTYPEHKIIETYIVILKEENTTIYDSNGQEILTGNYFKKGHCPNYYYSWHFYFAIDKSLLESIGGVSKLEIIHDRKSIEPYINNPELKENYQIIRLTSEPIIGAYRDIYSHFMGVSAISIYSITGKFKDLENPINIYKSKEIFIYDNDYPQKYKIFSVNLEKCNTNYCSLPPDNDFIEFNIDTNKFKIEDTNELDMNYSFISRPIAPNPIESIPKQSIFSRISCFFKKLFGGAC